jgi:RNA polymerase sigma factor (sigma-70 family)
MEQTLLKTDYLSAIRDGDSTSLRKMYREISPLIRKLIGNNKGTEEDAKDVFQDAVIIVFDKASLPEFQITSQFSTYFYGICRNLWRNQLQKKSSTEVTISDDAKYISDETPGIDFEKLERQKLYNKAFAKLAEDCQKLLRLFFEKVSMVEIAGQMGFGSEGYARRRKHLCKERLVNLVQEFPEYRELRSN